MNIYKRFTNKLVRQVKSNLNYTITDIIYSSYNEANQHVEFKVKEIPGWLFGLWYDTYKHQDDTYILGDFFAQYEDAIDKFKPSASAICDKVVISLDQDYVADFGVAFILGNIHKDPALAFCIFHYNWNVWEYHTKEEANQKFKEYKTWYKKNKSFLNKYKEKYYKFLTTEVAPLFGDTTIVESQEEWAVPRFKLVTENKELKFRRILHISTAAKILGLDLEAINKKWIKLDRQCESEANKNHICILSDEFIDKFIYVR